MASPALLIFDIDGTLFQARRVTVPAVQQTFAAYGLPEPEESAITSFFGRPVEEYHAWMAELCHAGAVDADALVADTDKRELELIGEEGALYPGVHETLAILRDAGYTMATSSNAPDDYMGEVLDRHDIRKYFHHVRCRGTRFAGKEEMVADLLATVPGLPTIIIGDRHDDVESAHAHSAQAIAITYGFGSEEELVNAEASVSNLREVPDTVARLLGD
jgi:phosphoglycolate phosphatase